MIEIGIAERKEREKSEMKELILNAARQLIKHDGLEKISIRRIAGMIEYSPAIIYHYFKNKDQIIEMLIAEDYGKIVKALSSIQATPKKPKDKLRECAYCYISMAVQMGDFYKSMMLSQSPEVLERTSVLQKGASNKRPPVAMLCSMIREMPALNNKNEAEIEAAAQIIWATAFGLAIRFIVENVDEQQKLRLINKAADFIIDSLYVDESNN